MELSFEQDGPARERSIALPPERKFLADYVLVFDEAHERSVYMAAPDFHQFGHAWTYDGAAFTPICTEAVHAESPQQRWQGVWDGARQAVVAWNFGRDAEWRDRTYAVVLRDGAVELLEPGGEQPQRLEDADEVGGCFAYDRKRDVTVCVTGRGVWELGAEGAWKKVRGEEELPTDEDWKEECLGGAWDPRSERTLFYWVCEDEAGDDQLFLWAWDGVTLERLSNEGLPEKLVKGWMNTGPVLVSHPDGAVLLSGWGRPPLVVGEAGFEPWGTHGGQPFDPPRPASAKAAICWDAHLGAFVAGPGSYEPEAGKYPQDQHLFWVGEPGGGFAKLGVTEEKSPIGELGGKRVGGFAAGRWHLMGYSSLGLMAWTPEGWETVVAPEAQRDLWDGRLRDEAGVNALVGLVDADGTLLAVVNDGQVFALEEGAWVRRAEADDALWKRRMWAHVAWDPEARRVVAWGGEVRGRRSNDVLLLDLEAGAWRKARARSPQPRAYGRPKDEGSVTQQLVWDHGLGALLRIGWEEAAVLEGEVFQPARPAGMAERNARDWRAVASDPKTGETLIVSFEHGTVLRFDLGRCEPVATFTLPREDLRLGHTNESLAYRVVCEDWAFDAATRRLHVQNGDDRWGHYVLDLGPAFEAAAARGPRTRPGEIVPPRSAARYEVGEAGETGARAWLAWTEAERLFVVEGEVGRLGEPEAVETASPAAAAEALEARLAEVERRGFVAAEALDEAQLKAIACAPTRALRLGEPVDAASAGSRLGGRPMDGSLEAWPTTERELMQQLSWRLPEPLNFFEVPEAQREELLAELRDGGEGSEGEAEPLGFLLQIATGELLERHAGVAVYVDTSGVATESLVHNRARLVPKDAWGEAAGCAPAAPTLEARALVLGEPGFELDEGRALALTRRDPALAEALEGLELAEPGGGSKLGGAPSWVQHPREILGRGQVPYRFLLQLDFDGLGGALAGWPDAGLFGVLYVFVHPDESAACAFWQHT